MIKVAVIGGTGYLASLIKSQKKIKNLNYFFFSRKKKAKYYFQFSNIEKNTNIIKKFDFIIHLLGPKKDQIKKNVSLIKKKKKITSKICDLCIKHNIKMIYISSMQIYKNYGNSNIHKKSSLNKKDLYARSHYEAEKIILKKFENKPKMFTILRLGNVFGFSEKLHLSNLSKNLIHDFCKSALLRKKIILKNGKIQRFFLPSLIFVHFINKTINKNILNNSIKNVGYRIFNLKEICLIIKSRYEKIFKNKIEIKFKKFEQKRKSLIFLDKDYRLNFNIRKINFEIDQILKNMKKIYIDE